MDTASGPMPGIVELDAEDSSKGLTASPYNAIRGFLLVFWGLREGLVHLGDSGIVLHPVSC